MSERLYFTSPDPDYIFADGAARVAPNEGSFPIDASVHVETDTHFLEFDIAPKNEAETEFVIALVDSLPPLAEAAHSELIIRDDILKIDQPFTLVTQYSRIAVQSFKAMRILTNVEQISVSMPDEDGQL